MNTEKMDVTVNSDKSFLGADIKKWCKINKKSSTIAREILNKYYADDRKLKPSQRAYYFIKLVSTEDGGEKVNVKLIRDNEKSPKAQHVRTMSRTEFIAETEALIVPVVTRLFVLYPEEDTSYSCRERLIVIKLSRGPIFIHLFRKNILIDTGDEEICFDSYYDAYKRISEYVQNDVKQGDN